MLISYSVEWSPTLTLANLSSSPVIFDQFCNSLSQYVYQSYFSNFVIVGDFNVDFNGTHPRVRVRVSCMLIFLIL